MVYKYRLIFYMLFNIYRWKLIYKVIGWIKGKDSILLNINI